MTRPLIAGYTINSDTEVATVNVALIPNDTPACNLTRKAWGIKQNSLTSSLAGVNNFEFYPQNHSTGHDALTTITINASTYSLDLAACNQNIAITLATDTNLTILNPERWVRYRILIIPNQYSIKNIVDVFKKRPIAWTEEKTLSLYPNEYLIELMYDTEFYADIQYSKNIDVATATAVTTELVDFVTPSNRILYCSWFSTVGGYSGSGVTASTIVGSPALVDYRLDLNGGRVEYTKHSSFNLNETDFTFLIFIVRESLGQYGSIFGSHSAVSPGFYVGVASDNTLTANFGTGITLTHTLVDNLLEHSIRINRMGTVYKMFVDNILVDYYNAPNNFNPNSTEPLCVGSLKTTLALPAFTSVSWQGLLKQFSVYLDADNAYSTKSTPEEDPEEANVTLRLHYPSNPDDTSQYVRSRSYTSDITTYPLLDTDSNLSKYSHIEYYSNTSLSFSFPVTFEAIFTNSAGNTRGLLISQENTFYWGVYDGFLRWELQTFVVSGIIPIVDEVETSVAMCFNHTTKDYKMFVNGVLDVQGNTGGEGIYNATVGSIAIKREANQNNAPAALNTSLFKSKSWIAIKGIRLTNALRYTTNYIPPFSFDA